jgi:hypothetical protein
MSDTQIYDGLPSDYDWYMDYGAHVSTNRCGDITIQAVDPRRIECREDQEDYEDLLLSEYPDMTRDEASQLIDLAMSVWDETITIHGLLADALAAYRDGDLDLSAQFIRDARAAESKHGDTPSSDAYSIAIGL